MAKAKKTAVANATAPAVQAPAVQAPAVPPAVSVLREMLSEPAQAPAAPLFPTAEQMHATTQALLNAPPKGINWEGFDKELGESFNLVHQADESVRTLAGKMFVCGFRFAMMNNEKGELADTPATVELRKRLTRRLSDREQTLLSMDRFTAATLTTLEKAQRKLARDRVNNMVSLIRKHLKTVEEITSGRGSKTLEQRLYAKCTEILEAINAADPDKAKFEISEARDLVIELREHFNI